MHCHEWQCEVATCRATDGTLMPNAGQLVTNLQQAHSKPHTQQQVRLINNPYNIARAMPALPSELTVHMAKAEGCATGLFQMRPECCRRQHGRRLVCTHARRPSRGPHLALRLPSAPGLHVCARRCVSGGWPSKPPHQRPLQHPRKHKQTNKQKNARNNARKTAAV